MPWIEVGGDLEQGERGEIGVVDRADRSATRLVTGDENDRDGGDLGVRNSEDSACLDETMEKNDDKEVGCHPPPPPLSLSLSLSLLLSWGIILVY